MLAHKQDIKENGLQSVSIQYTHYAMVRTDNAPQAQLGGISSDSRPVVLQ